MSEIPVLIRDLTILLVMAAATTLICKKINLPSVLGYILAGFLAGPVVTFIPTISDTSGIEVWSEIGVIFLMFGLGLEFSVHKMGEVGVSGFLSAGIQAVGMGLVGFLLGFLLGWSTMDSVFLGVMLAMSSTMIAMKNIEDMGMKNEKFSELAMGTLVIEDIIAIFAMVILSTISASQSVSGVALLEKIGLLLLYLAVWVILGTYLLPSVMKKLVGLMNDEVLLIFSLGLCFLMAMLAQVIGLSTELGAFLAGSLLAGTVHAERVEQLVTPCKNLFGAIFFISVGFMVQPAMIGKYILVILLLSACAIFFKLLFLTVGSLAAGQELDTSLKAAAAQTQVGEFSFIIAGLGQSLKVTGDFLYPVIVAVSVITTFTTPFMMRLATPLGRFLEKRLPERCLTYAKGKPAEKKNEDWPLFLKDYFIRMILYVILSAGILRIAQSVVYPFLLDRVGEEEFSVRVLTLILVYLVLGLLLPAMLRVKKRYFTALWLDSVYNRLALCFLLGLRLGVAVVIAVVPAVLFVRLNPIWASLVALPMILLMYRSNRITGHYLQVEARFLANLNERKLTERFGEREEVHHWLTEQLLVMTLLCPEPCALDGTSLMELNWGKTDHVKIIQILRGKERLNIPEGYIRVHNGDRLISMGERKDLENFALKQSAFQIRQVGDMVTLKEYIASQEGIPESRQLLCCGVSADKSLNGKAIRESGIKEEWGAFLIGLERNRLPIANPNPNLNLKTGDLLWVMGSQRMATTLVFLGLLD